MKKILLILSLALALCMLCFAAVAEEETKHDYNFDKDNPLNHAEVVMYPSGDLAGVLRVHCVNHPDDEEDVKEYAIYGSPCVFMKKNAAIAAALAGDPAVVDYKAADCKAGIDGYVTVACTAEHGTVVWKDGKLVAHDPNCSETKKYTIKAAHVWSDENEPLVGEPYRELVTPTCSTGGRLVAYCLNCGTNKDEGFAVDPLNHRTLKAADPTGVLLGDPDVKEVTTKATCVKEGKVEKVCNLCGKTLTAEECAELGFDEYPKTLPIDPNNHVNRSVWILDVLSKEPTCTEMGEGWYHQICLDCKLVFGSSELREVPALGHDFGDWETVKEATCTEKGSKKRVCSRCQLEEEDDIEINPKAHPAGSLILKEYEPATCTEEGYKKYLCEVCNNLYTLKLSALGHKYSDEISLIDGVCDEDADEEARRCLRVKWCVQCHADYELVEDLGIKPHDFNEWVCRNHYGVAPDGTIIPEYWVRYCKNCAYQEEYIEKDKDKIADKPDPHTHVWMVKEAVEPSCSEFGMNEYWYCSVCGAIDPEHPMGDPIPMLGHDYQKVDAVEASCTEEGKTASMVCTVCGDVLIAPVVTPKLDHTPEVEIEGTPAGCEVAGKTDKIVCSVCHTVLQEQEDIPALGHDPKVEDGQAATCTKAGFSAYTVCGRCGIKLIGEEVLPALGHDWNDGEITTEPSPEAAGVKTFTCERCGEKRTEEVPYKFSEPDYKFDGGVSYAGNKITGTVKHVYGTADCRLYARVTAFFVGGNVAVFSDIVEDGIVDIELRGNVLAYSVELVGTKATVPGQKVFDTAGEYFRGN